MSLRLKSNNKIYWNKYYNSKNNNNKPSNFALFVNKNYIKKNTFLIDVGSGDGRDSFYLRKKAKHVYSIDQSNIAIKKNKLKTRRLGFKNVTFKNLSSNHLHTSLANNLQLATLIFFYSHYSQKTIMVFLSLEF